MLPNFQDSGINKKPSRTEGFAFKKDEKVGNYFTSNLVTIPSDVFTKYIPVVNFEVSMV
jgi:hypothetical protein